MSSPTPTPTPKPFPEFLTESSYVTKRAFLNRFTDDEAIAIDLASFGQTVEAATVRRHMSKFEVSPFVDLRSNDTVNGLQALEAAGLLAAGRAAEILTAPIQEQERFNG